jgi:hypothetical protein
MEVDERNHPFAPGLLAEWGCKRVVGPLVLIVKKNRRVHIPRIALERTVIRRHMVQIRRLESDDLVAL